MTNFAIDQGYFKRNGLDVTANEVKDAVLHVASISSGRADVTLMSLETALPAMAKGVDLKLISGASSNLWQLWTTADSKISSTFPQSIRDLKGKKIGVATLGSAGEYTMQKILQAAGMKPADVQFVAYGAALANAAVALESGKVDAAMGGEMAHYLLPKGGRKLVDFVAAPDASFPSDLAQFAGAPYLGVLGAGKWVSEHPDAVHKIQVTMAEANCWVSNPANLQTYTTWIANHQGIPKKVPQSEWENYVSSSIHGLAYFPRAMAQAWVDNDVQFGKLKQAIPLSSFYEDGIPQSLDEAKSIAQANGFKC